MQPTTPDPTQKRLKKTADGRQPIQMRLTKKQHEQLAADAKKQERTMSNLAYIRYQRGCEQETSTQA